MSNRPQQMDVKTLFRMEKAGIHVAELHFYNGKKKEVEKDGIM